MQGSSREWRKSARAGTVAQSICVCARVEWGYSSAGGYVYVNGIMGGTWRGEAEENRDGVCVCVRVCVLRGCVRAWCGQIHRRDSKFAGAV